ncbi:MAG: GNAT family N-acetyltransferase [candidate division Zixibacteria bacterium]
MITLREITAESLRSIIDLKVAENQKSFVKPNAVSIAQAYFDKNAWFRAIYDGEAPIGFVMLWLDTEKAEYWLWRFMIDEKFQKKGFGYQAMKIIIEHVRILPNATRFGLTYASGDGDPSQFYAKLGFVETGEWQDDQKVMMLEL